MTTTTAMTDLEWFAKRLSACDNADMKLFYLRRAFDNAQGRHICATSSHSPLQLLLLPSGDETAKCDLAGALAAARLISCDERTLWECMGDAFANAFTQRVDLWNEQLAVKMVYRFVAEHADRSELRVALEAYMQNSIKPRNVNGLNDVRASFESGAFVSADGESAAVTVIPMLENDDHSEGSLVCSRPVAAFGDLLRIPRTEMFFAASVRAHCALAAALASHSQLASITESEEALLLLCLVYERYVVGVTQSHWCQLLSFCPLSYPTVPSFWHFSELSEFEGTDVLDDVLEKKSQIADFCAQVEPVLPLLHATLHSRASPCATSLEAFCAAFTVDALLWARATFDSRAFKLNVDNDVVLALVPLADMVNHTNHSDVLFRKVEPDGGEFVMQVGAALGEPDVGRELWMSYGPLQNWELLQFYGFVMNDNSHDKLPFPFAVIPPAESSDPVDTRRFSLVSTFALYAPKRCWIGYSGVPCEALLGLLRIHLAQGTEVDSMERSSPFTSLSSETEQAVVDTVRQTVRCVLDQFSSTLEEDEDALAEAQRPASARVSDADEGSEEEEDPHAWDNYILCLRLRIGLKRIAHRCLTWCDAHTTAATAVVAAA